MKQNTMDFLGCDALDDDLTSGLAKKNNFGNQGSSSEPNYISLIKLQTSVKEDPNKRYKAKNGTHFFQIRPNDAYTKPSRENDKYGKAQDWNWYLLSCPHQPPCPFL